MEGPHISDISFPGLPMVLNQQKSLSSWILVAFNMVGKTATSIDSIIDIHESPILKVFSCHAVISEDPCPATMMIIILET